MESLQSRRILLITVGATVLLLLHFTKEFSFGIGVVAAMVAFVLLIYNMCLLLCIRGRRLPAASASQIVFITGCDSGLGFSLALHAHGMGFTVVAGCLQADGDGASRLTEKCPDRLHIIQVDITKTASIQAAAQRMLSMLTENPHLELKALINNAGVMIFGEFEWLTENHMLSQTEVNLLGTMRITKNFCSMLRKYKGRIITITSHCALATLPGLAVYGATKAALTAWSDGLRVEQAKYGVPVITFIPGSFIQHSGIMSRQSKYAKEMEDAMTSEDRKFFGNYFMEYNQYLCGVQTPTSPVQLVDPELYTMFEDALLSHYPQPHYEHGPARYQLYHFLFRISPTWLRDYLVVRFMQMPSWKNDSH